MSPPWIASALLAVLITAITWKLVTRARITWVQESKKLAKPLLHSEGPDLEQPLLEESDAEIDTTGQGRSSSNGPAPGLARISTRLPVSIPVGPAEEDEHDDHHAHSPMAYSAVGSFALKTKKPTEW